MTDGLDQQDREIIIDILSSNERVERVVLYGSRVLGTFRPASDIDIALFGDSLTFSDVAQLAYSLEETTIPQKIDLLLYSTLTNHDLRNHIKESGVEWFNHSIC